MPANLDPLAALGLSSARVRELTTHLSRLHSPEESPDEALDALLFISSLAQPDDAARICLMGGGILDALADIICICDEEWVSGGDAYEANEIKEGDDEEDDEGPSHLLDPEEKDALDLCSHGLNALGSMATFEPFVVSLLEEDRADEPMEHEVIQPIAEHINRAPATKRQGEGSAAATAATSAAAPFQVRRFTGRSLLAYYPLLTATLFWLRTNRFRACRAQAAFALSWLLTLRPIAGMMHEVGLASHLFEILQLQVDQAAASRAAGGANTPDSTSSSGGGGGGERVSATQENLRLYTCICLQRLSRAGFSLFSDPLEPEGTSAARLQVLLALLASVHSFNIRAIVLNVILQAVRVPSPAEQDAARAQGAATSSSSAASSSTPDLILPQEALDALRDFRASCGSIGSSASSRRTSPAFGALVAARGAAAGMPSLGGVMHSAATAASSAAPAASASRSWRANSAASSATAPAAAAATPVAAMSYSAAASTPPVPAAAPAVEDTVDGADDDEVSELSRDPEAGLDKTAHLQQLVDAILRAHAAEAAK